MLRGILFAPAITGLLLALTLAKGRGWADPLTGGLLIGSALVLAYWIRHQLGQARPLIHLRAFADRRVATAYFCMAMVGAGMTQHSLIMTMLLQQRSAAIGFGLAAGVAGSLLMPVRLIGIASSAGCGRLVAKRGGRAGLIAGSLFAVSGWLLILFCWDSLALVMAGMLLEGAGYLACYVAVPTILLAASPAERAGEVTGISTVCRAAFSAIGAQVVMLLLASFPDPAAAGATPSVTGFRLGFLFILAVCAACLAGAVSLPVDARSRRARAEPRRAEGRSA